MANGFPLSQSRYLSENEVQTQREQERSVQFKNEQIMLFVVLLTVVVVK